MEQELALRRVLVARVTDLAGRVEQRVECLPVFGFEGREEGGAGCEGVAGFEREGGGKHVGCGWTGDGRRSLSE